MLSLACTSFQQVAPHHEVHVSHCHIMDLNTDANDQLCREGGFCLKQTRTERERNQLMVGLYGKFLTRGGVPLQVGKQDTAK